MLSCDIVVIATMKQFMDQESGFTLIELIITIVIIGILAGIVVFSPKTFLVSARDQERSDDTHSIVRRLEQAYTSQDLGYPAYPSTAELSSDIATKTRTMTRLSPDALKAPGVSEVTSVIIATSTSLTAPAGANAPTLSQYVYQPLAADGSLCTASPSTSSPCVRFYLYYRKESDNSLQKIKSLHQQ